MKSNQRSGKIKEKSFDQMMISRKKEKEVTFSSKRKSMAEVLAYKHGDANEQKLFRIFAKILDQSQWKDVVEQISKDFLSNNLIHYIKKVHVESLIQLLMKQTKSQAFYEESELELVNYIILIINFWYTINSGINLAYLFQMVKLETKLIKKTSDIGLRLCIWQNFSLFCPWTDIRQLIINQEVLQNIKIREINLQQLTAVGIFTHNFIFSIPPQTKLESEVKKTLIKIIQYTFRQYNGDLDVIPIVSRLIVLDKMEFFEEILSVFAPAINFSIELCMKQHLQLFYWKQLVILLINIFSIQKQAKILELDPKYCILYLNSDIPQDEREQCELIVKRYNIILQEIKLQKEKKKQFEYSFKKQEQFCTDTVSLGNIADQQEDKKPRTNIFINQDPIFKKTSRSLSVRNTIYNQKMIPGSNSIKFQISSRVSVTPNKQNQMIKNQEQKIQRGNNLFLRRRQRFCEHNSSYSCLRLKLMSMQALNQHQSGLIYKQIFECSTCNEAKQQMFHPTRQIMQIYQDQDILQLRQHYQEYKHLIHRTISQKMGVELLLKIKLLNMSIENRNKSITKVLFVEQNEILGGKSLPNIIKEIQNAQKIFNQDQQQISQLQVEKSIGLIQLMPKLLVIINNLSLNEINYQQPEKSYFITQGNIYKVFSSEILINFMKLQFYPSWLNIINTLTHTNPLFKVLLSSNIQQQSSSKEADKFFIRKDFDGECPIILLLSQNQPKSPLLLDLFKGITIRNKYLKTIGFDIELLDNYQLGYEVSFNYQFERLSRRKSFTLIQLFQWDQNVLTSLFRTFNGAPLCVLAESKSQDNTKEIIKVIKSIQKRYAIAFQC